MPRGRGRPYRTVAMSLAREDYTRAPRCELGATYIQPELYFLAVSGQFHDLGSKEGKIDYVRAEHPPEYRLVAPISWATLSVHVVASKASHAALEVYIVSEGTKLIASVTVCLSVSDIQRRGEHRGANDACCHADERPGERTTLLLVRVR